MRGRTVALIGAAAVVAAWPTSAHAHLVQSGLGPFYDGIAHFTLSPDDWLFVVATALLGGLSGARGGRSVLFALPIAWVVGGLVGLTRQTVADWPAVSAATLVVTGALVAWNPRLRGEALTAIAVVFGALHGYLNGSLGAAGGFAAPGLAGVAATVFVVTALAAALVVALRGDGARIVVRIAGSWIAAIGLLLAGWSLRA
jgi:hydrogenase/urease accessory protein HupE